ncbi:MAG: TIGR04086 family membrane protein [Bacillota bacterium]|nr:TIGR04086 family membrane protein [Bacillota bacterium]
MREREDLKEEGKINLYVILKGVLKALFITATLLFLLALIYLWTDLSEGTEKIMVTLTAILSIIIAAFSGARKLKKQGLLTGTGTGLIYAIILYITGFLAFDFPGFNKGIAATFLLCAFAGAVGGIIGVNVRSRRKKYR